MKQYRPVYYKDFVCTASACSDNCCIGWEIDIDGNSLEKYKNCKGEFSRRLKESIVYTNSTASFALRNERCAFLNKDNLCDIYINLGEEALCEICTQHPRYHEWYGEIKESGVGLCCEAAGRLIFEGDSIAEFETAEIEEQADDFPEEQLYLALCYARLKAFDIIENGNILSLFEFSKAVQFRIDNYELGHIFSITEPNSSAVPTAKDISMLLEFLQSLDPIDPEYPNVLKSIQQNLPLLLKSLSELKKVYPHFDKNIKQLCAYFIYRYWCKATFDEDVYSKGVLAVVASIAVALLCLYRYDKQNRFGTDDFVYAAKQFSKEIEYNTDNLYALYDYIWE